MSFASLVAQFGKSMTQYTNNQQVDAGGALYSTWSAELEPITVYLQPALPNESVRNGATRMTTRMTGYCDPEANISLTDRLYFSPYTFEVVGVRVPDLRSAPDGMAYKILSLETVEGQS